jgi:hypothetical protein
MRGVAEQIVAIIQSKNNATVQSALCVVGRPLGFTNELQMDVSYAIRSGHKVTLGKLVVAYSKPLLGTPKVNVLESKRSTEGGAEYHGTAFGLEETLPVIAEENRGSLGLIDDHKPWLYRVINGRAAFAKSFDLPFAPWFEREVAERVEHAD